jgi:hypothetical protein
MILNAYPQMKILLPFAFLSKPAKRFSSPSPTIKFNSLLSNQNDFKRLSTNENPSAFCISQQAS